VDHAAHHHWSAAVGRNSHALDLEPGLFSWDNPQRIARSLWRAAELSQRRKRSVYGSAMAMLCFYINRAGSRLTQQRLAILEQTKEELRQLHQTPPAITPQSESAGSGWESIPAWECRPPAGHRENGP
jgi:hypothetical protein